MQGAINTDLAARSLLLREGTLRGATLIAAPASTKNLEKQRAPKMHQTRKDKDEGGTSARIGTAN